MSDVVSTGATAPAVRVDGIRKRYGATQALDDVSVSIMPGQIHGLVGRNGAGKSTLLRMVTGIEEPDAGSVRFFGDAAPSISDRAAWQHRVACVYQRPAVFANLSVAENLYAGRLPTQGGRVGWGEVTKRAGQVLREWDLSVDPRMLMEDVPLEQRQMIQIAKALDAGTRIILLDEPTVQLERAAILRLFDKVRQLQATGVTFVYVSHFLQEVTELCDSATVLRDGTVLWSRSGEDIREDDLVEALLGGQERHRTRVAAAQKSGARPVLAVSGATDAGGAFGDVSFEVGPGEIVAIGGIGGSGKYAVGEALAGLAELGAGVIAVDGEPIGTGVPAAQSAGIGYVPADRHRDGYVPQLSVAENVTMSVMPALATRGWFRPGRQLETARTLIDDVGLVPADPKLAVSNLSGGNQQKVVLARALALEPRVLVLVSPTAGVDIAAKNAIYALMVKALKQGVAVVMISDDIEELLICPRVLIMRDGTVASELQTPDEESIIRAIEGMEN